MKRFAVAGIFLCIVFLLGAAWWIHGMEPVNPHDKTVKNFTIQKGEPLREIANHLQASGLIQDPIVFFFVVKTSSLDNKIEAGDFKLSPSMNTKQIEKSLTTGTEEVRITIPEGYRAAEIAVVLQQNFPQYQANWQSALQQNEGYLFPDTYLFSKDTTVQQIITIMRNNFTTKFDSITTNPNNPYTQQQIVTVASLIEREAKYPEDRPLVASVIYNRLNANMPLQVDATVQYALGYQTDTKTWWKKDLTTNDLAINSPYNTYKQIGLPPTPIANPGLDALQAAVKPAQTSYLYYVSDASGHNHYEETLDQHNADIEKYGL